MSDKFSNLQTDGEITGQNPDAREDYFTIADYSRDHDYWQNRIAQVVKSLSAHPNTDVQILYGGHVHDGGGGTVDVEEGVALGFDIDGEVRIVKLPEQTGLALPSGWNDNRQIWVVSKYDFELTSDTRQHYNAETYHHVLQDSHHADAQAYGNGSGPPTNTVFLDASPASTYVIWGSFQMNGATFALASGRSQEFGGLGLLDQTLVNNIGLSYSSSILKIVQANGADLGAGGFGLIGIPNLTGRGTKTFRIYKNTHLFEDDGGTSDIVGEEFGATTGVAWGNNRPYFLYVVNSDDTDEGVEFAISPNPTARVSPAAANCGYHGNPAATPSDDNFFFMASANITTTHNSKPCRRIGGLRMQMSAADDQTVQALSWASGDGIRPDPFVGREFVLPPDQMGANAATDFFTSANAPTWATPASINARYILQLNGMVRYLFTTTNAGNCTNGTDAATARLVLPYLSKFTGPIPHMPCGAYTVGGANGVLVGTMTPNQSYIDLNTSAIAPIANNAFANVADDVRVYVEFLAFRV